MDITELEELLHELLEEHMPDFHLEKNRKGEILIYSGLKENEDGEVVSLDEEEDLDDDPDFSEETVPYEEDDEEE